MTAPAMHIKVSGTFKAVNKMHVRVSGAWKRVNNAYVNVSGTWKKFLQSVVACTISADLNASGSTVTVTSTSRTITVDASNSGQCSLANVVASGGTFQYKKGAGSFTTTTGVTLTFSNGEALQVRGTSLTSGDTINFDLVDVDTGTTIGSYLVQRT